ncbi:hypothetical protein HMPREF9554_00909 [Treponema phagedenis F0421]|nr:hypothetical protein HMPREF9554_00909 [Treponema phagedenis F0421]
MFENYCCYKYRSFQTRRRSENRNVNTSPVLLAQGGLGYASPRSCVPLTPAPEECKFQNGHGRPRFHADGLVFATDGKN